MKLDYQYCEQDNKLNAYIENGRREESLLLLESKGAGLNKMSIAGAVQKDRLNQTKLGKEINSRNSLSQDIQKNSIPRLRHFSNDQSQIRKQSSSVPSSSSSLRSVPQNLSVLKSTAERAKSDNISDVHNKVGSLSSSPKWSRIKDKFEKGDTSPLLERKEPPSKVLSSGSNVSIKKGTLQKRPPESKVMPLQSRSININVPSAKLKCSSLPYKLVNASDRIQERTKRPLAFRTHTKLNSLENNSLKPTSLGNLSIQPTQSVLSRLHKTTVNLSEEVAKQKVKIPIRSVDCKKNENSDCQAKKVPQEAKVTSRTIDCQAKKVPQEAKVTSRTIDCQKVSQDAKVSSRTCLKVSQDAKISSRTCQKVSQDAKVSSRTTECQKVTQDAKISSRTIDCHPVPTSRTSLTKPKTLEIYSNVSLHSANIGKPLRHAYKGKFSKERCTSNGNEMLTKCEVEEKVVDSTLKLQKYTDTLSGQRTRTVSDSGQATHLRLTDCEVTESKVAYLTNKFNFLSCQNLEMKKSCSAVSVDEANKYVLSKSFSASNVFSTTLRKSETCCQKSSQKPTSLTCSDEILSECVPTNGASCAVMEKCSCLGLFSKQTDHYGTKPENDHICRTDSEICTQPLGNNIQIQDLTSAENERLNLVQKAVLSYEENLVLLSPETQRKNYLSRLKDSPVTINGSGFNDTAVERMGIAGTKNQNCISTEKTVLKKDSVKIKRVVSNKETTRYSNDSQKLNADKSVKEGSFTAKALEGNKQENSNKTLNSHMLSKSTRSLTLDSIRCTSSFLHNLTSSKEGITTKTKELQLNERQYVNQTEMKMQSSLQPNSSFLWTSSSSAYQKSSVLADNHHYENSTTMVLGENSSGQSGQQAKCRKQSNGSISIANNGSCDSDDQGSWIDVSDAEADNEKHDSNSVAISTLRRNKGKKDTQKRNSLRRSWSESLRATANDSDCNDDEYQDVSAWESIDGENSSGSTEMENQYESLYESIYQNINFDDRSNSSHSPDDSNKHNSDTSSEIFDNDDDIISLNSEKTTVSLDDKKKSMKRQWSLSRSDIKTELTSKLNRIISKKNSHSSAEIGPKTREKNTETKSNTLMRYFRGQKSKTAGPLLGSSIGKRELSTFYINERDIKSEDTLHCNKLSNSSLHSVNSTSIDEKVYPVHTFDNFKKPLSEKAMKPVLRRHVQRPTAPPPLPPDDPIAKCRGGTKSMEFIRSQAVTFNKTRSLDSTYYNALSEGNVLYSEITIRECSLPNKNSVGEISSISTSEEMITSSSSSERTISENSSLSSCSKGSRYSENCYSVSSSTTDSSSLDRDRNSVFSFNRANRANSGSYQLKDNNMGGNNTADCDSNKHQNKTEILKSPFEEEPLYQFYLKDVRTRATLWQRMKSDDEQSETESVYVNVSEESTNGPLVLKSQLSAMELIKGDEMGQRTLWCHVPEVKKSGLLATLSPQDRNFQEAMFEVITSEASYLKSLNILIEHFIQCPEFAEEFSPRCVLNRRDRHVLFSDVLPVKEVSERFLADLERHWKENIMLSRVCEILHNHAAKYFSVYVRYCSNQIYQDRTLKDLKETKPEFTEVLNRLESSTVCQCLDMHSFLMLPMQRITRLPLLVDAIFHRLSLESPQYETCKATLALLNKVVQDCNDGARKMERMEEMLSIERQLDFKDCKGIPLISTSRWLVKKGELTRFICDTSSKRTISFSTRWCKVPVYLFLFTDYLMVTKKKSEENFAVLDYCPRNMVQVVILEEDDNERLPFRLPSSGKSFFQLTILSNHKKKTVELILGVSLESERTRWMDAVTPPISDNPDERIYEVWDCPQVQCIYSYTAQQPDELMLEESDVVNVFRKMSDGWYEGERIRDGVRGWFPASYTEEIVSSHVRARNLRQHYRLLISLEKAKTYQGK